MTLMAGYSFKAWWLAIGSPVVGFLAASVMGAAIVTAIVAAALLSFHTHGGRHGL